MRMTRAEAALKYAERGWWIFPIFEMRGGVCSCGSGSCTAGKHPRTKNGLHDASNDPTVVKGWWQRWPDANIGLATGRGIAVVDLDVRPGKNGIESWDKLGIDVDTLVCETGGGGFHLYFHILEKVSNSVGRLGRGIDVRGDGGYVILPPSNHLSGKDYQWMEGTAEIAEMPEELLQVIRASKKRRKQVFESGAKFGQGERNDGMTSLAGALRQKGLGRDALLAALLAENEQRCIPPLPEDEIERIAESVVKYQPGGGFDFTEHGNAERMMFEFGSRIRYVCTWKKWLVWDERRWRMAGAESKMERFAKLTIAEMRREAGQIDDEDLAKAMKKWGRASRRRSMYSNMVALCASEPGVPVFDDKLDSEPMLLNLTNGTLDLRTGELRDHSPGDLMTQLAGVEWDEDAQCPTWERFVFEICDGDAELVSYLQKSVGYSLTGRTDEHVLFFCYGHGANGKSTFLETLLKLLGEYGMMGAPGLLQRDRGGSTRSHPTEQAALHQKRMVICQEVEEGSPWNEPVVKHLTGGDTMTVRRLYEDYWEMRPTHTLWVSGNARPVVRESTDGIWRRMKLVPFTVSFKGREDHSLSRKLAKELPGIMRWAVEGCLEWQKRGLGQALTVLRASEQYRHDMDILAPWFEECLEVHDTRRHDCWVSRKELQQSYQRWCMTTGERGLTNRRLYRELENRGFRAKRKNNKRGFAGLKLRQGQEGLHLVR